MRRHVHLYFSRWTNESRAWRAGQLAIDQGLSDIVDYVGPVTAELPSKEPHGLGQHIVRIGPMPAPPGSPVWQRALALPKWFGAVYRHDFDGLDLIIAHSLASLPAGILLARRYRIPLLYDAHELESEREGWSAAVRRLARLAERLMIGRADHVVTVNESIADWYRTQYPAASVGVVRNVPDVPATIGTSNLRATLGIADTAIVYVYCGQLSQGRGIEPLIEAFARVDPAFHLVLIGSGPKAGDYARQAAAVPNVHLHPAVPHDQLITLLRGADVGIWINTGSSLSYRLALPNKVFEYAAAGLGLCLGPGQELDRIAESYPAARRVSTDPAQIAATVSEWTPEELKAGRQRIGAEHQVNWSTEKAAMAAAIQIAMERGRARWGRVAPVAHD